MSSFACSRPQFHISFRLRASVRNFTNFTAKSHLILVLNTMMEVCVNNNSSTPAFEWSGCQPAQPSTARPKRDFRFQVLWWFPIVCWGFLPKYFPFLHSASPHYSSANDPHLTEKVGRHSYMCMHWTFRLINRHKLHSTSVSLLRCVNFFVLQNFIACESVTGVITCTLYKIMSYRTNLKDDFPFIENPATSKQGFWLSRLQTTRCLSFYFDGNVKWSVVWPNLSLDVVVV